MQDLQQDVEAIARIDVVPTILEVVCLATGMGFAAVARVTEDRWSPAPSATTSASACCPAASSR